jgi:hydroxymethylbilane synthase
MDEQLTIGGLSERADPSDILIIGKHAHDPQRRMRIKEGSIVGTSSIRRKVQLIHFAKSLRAVDIRGNVPTRIKKIDEGVVDAVILASAGIDRLEIDLSEYITLRYNPAEFVPAPAQGVNAYQCRTNDKSVRRILRSIHQSEVSKCTNIEREILRLLDGGCQLPLGAFVQKDNLGYHCHSVLGSTLGAPLKRYQYSQSTSAGMAAHIVSQLKL